MPRPISAEDYRVRASFETLRQRLLGETFADRQERPLAYWTLPADRRLPLALLGRSLRELLRLSSEELAATPGIGLKKLGMMLTLLERATQDQAVAADPTPTVADTVDRPSLAQSATQNQDGFDPALVSEQTWEHWCETVRQHGLGQEKLGRLAPSLKDLPTVIWHTPMSAYLDRRLADIRQLKTHGEKRIRVILGVFHVVHVMLSSSGRHGPLAVRLLPRFVRPVEEWVTEVLGRPEAPTPDDVRQYLALPLLNQTEVDAGPSVLKLAEDRLGIESPPQTVRVLSRGLGVTRARVYQLLEITSRVMEVRWPEGRMALSQLAERFAKSGVVSDDLALFHRVRDLFYPQAVSTTAGGATATALSNESVTVAHAPTEPTAVSVINGESTDATPRAASWS